MGILFRELGKLYCAFSHGGIAGLSELPLQYMDYVPWQRERMEGTLLKQQLDYWKKQLGGAQPILDLPTDRPRSARQTFRGATCSIEFSAETASGLKKLAREKDLTLFMVLLAGFQTLLYPYSRQ